MSVHTRPFYCAILVLVACGDAGSATTSSAPTGDNTEASATSPTTGDNTGDNTGSPKIGRAHV